MQACAAALARSNKTHLAQFSHNIMCGLRDIFVMTGPHLNTYILV